MATHTEISNIQFDEGKYRLCLDRVVRDDEDGRTEYAFVWRGTEVSADGFVPRPAYFRWEWLGHIMRDAATSGDLERQELSDFLMNLMGIG